MRVGNTAGAARRSSFDLQPALWGSLWRRTSGFGTKRTWRHVRLEHLWVVAGGGGFLLRLQI